MGGVPELKVKDRDHAPLSLYNQGTHHLPVSFGSLLSTHPMSIAMKAYLMPSPRSENYSKLQLHVSRYSRHQILYLNKNEGLAYIPESSWKLDILENWSRSWAINIYI